MTEIYKILASLVAFLSFLFIFWRKLREDYLSSQIFSLGILGLVSLVVTVILVEWYGRVEYRWLSVVVPFCVMTAYSIKNHMRINEVTNALFPALVIGNICYLLLEPLPSKKLLLFLVLANLLFLPLFFFLESNYKRIQWYKSGKIGFSGLLSSSIFFAANAAVAFSSFPMIFFVGKINAVVLLVLAVFSLLWLFLLSRKIA